MSDLVILTTGGTIDKVYFDALSEFQVGETVVPQILRAGLVRSDIRVETLMSKDSLDLTDTDRSVIHEAVLRAPETRIVITHGTDTMTETAKTLLDVANKTIVLVGALSPARFAHSDAHFNLGMAVAAAQLAGPGVWIAMNGIVFPAERVRKDRGAGAFVPV
jgi:L-asparaginase